ncbi:MAG: ATP-binding protein [Gemmataceae bacterium]
MSSETAPWALTIPSEPRLLPLTRAFIEAVCHMSGLDDTATHHVVLAVDEAANNIIRHAHRGASHFPITIQCYVKEQGLEIHLLDHGEPFDLDAIPHLDPAELRPGGRGVFLMRQLMDEIRVVPRPEGGNILFLFKRRSSRDSPDYQN